MRFKTLLSDVSRMADEPDWAKVLSFLYENDGRHAVVEDVEKNQPSHEGRPTQEKALERDLLDRLNLKAKDRSEVHDILVHLETVDLSERNISASLAEIKLVSNGFNVAHERELSKRRDRTNTTLVGFTLALVLANLVAVLPSAWAFLGYEFNLRFVGAFVLLEVVVWYILQKDLHEDLLDS